MNPPTDQSAQALPEGLLTPKRSWRATCMNNWLFYTYPAYHVKNS